MHTISKHTSALPTVPALFTRSYLGLAEEHGYAPAEVLRKAVISSPQDPAGPALSLEEYLRLLDTIADLLGPAISIGTEMGWRITPAALGPLGTAVLSCPTGHDALALCRRFWHFYGTGLTFDIITLDGMSMLQLQTLPSLVPDTHRHTVLEAMIAGFVRGITAVQRIELEQLTVWFDVEEPVYADSVRHRLGNVHWGMPTCGIRWPVHLLDDPLPQGSKLALDDALRQCEQSERLLGKRMNEIVERVRCQLVLQDDRYPGLETVAARLNMSTRTLRRRLQDQDLRFIDLVHTARRRDAFSLLTLPTLEVAQIAQMLGYADPANFTRAFRQWTGLTPSAWREAHRTAPP